VVAVDEPRVAFVVVVVVVVVGVLKEDAVE
jgi:hypothetical protein